MNERMNVDAVTGGDVRSLSFGWWCGRSLRVVNLGIEEEVWLSVVEP